MKKKNTMMLMVFCFLWLGLSTQAIDRTKKIKTSIVLESTFTNKVDNPKAHKPKALFNRAETKLAAKRGSARKAVEIVVKEFLEKVAGDKLDDLLKKHKDKLDALIFDEYKQFIDSYDDTGAEEESWLNKDEFKMIADLRAMDKRYGWRRWKRHTASDEYSRLGASKKKRTIFPKNVILSSEYLWTIRLDKVQAVLQKEIRIDGGSKLQSLKIIVDFRNELTGEASYKMSPAEKTTAVETLEASLKEDDFTVVPLEIVIDRLKVMISSDKSLSTTKKEEVKSFVEQLEGKGKGFESSNAGYQFLQKYSNIVMVTRVAITKGSNSVTATLRIKAYTTPSIKFPAVELAGTTSQKETAIIVAGSDVKSTVNTIIKRASAKASSALKVNIRDYFLKRAENRKVALKSGVEWTIRLVGDDADKKEEVFSLLSRNIRRKIFRKMKMDDDSYSVDDTNMEVKFVWKGKIFKFEDAYYDQFEDHDVLGKLVMKKDKAQRVIILKIK